jgi:MFS family permease
MQAVLGPVIASASDTFQARKPLLVGSSVVSFIGSAIAPGSGNIYRLIVAQILIGVGFASVPLGYCVPSEILPRKWRPMAQACINVWASFGAIASPLIIGAFTKSNVADGWRKFYWFQMALWGATAIGIFVGYRPPKRHTRFEHLSLWQKLGHLDLPGFALLTIGLTLFLVGVNLGGGLYTWTNAHTLSTLITGIVVLGAFGVYEWKGTKTGILHHDLFRGGKAKGRTFAILVGLIFIEGILLFAFVIFYPVM